VIEFTLKVKVLTENDTDIQSVLDRMHADGRIALATANFELDVTDIRLHGSPAGQRHPGSS
jgi:hypothetical protein